MPLSKSRSVLLCLAVGAGGGFIGLVVWISTLFAFAHFGKFPDPNGIFNSILVLVCALVFLPLLHRRLYRSAWCDDVRMQHGLLPLHEPLTGSDMPPPAPRTVRTPAQTALYAACYLLAVPALLWLFLPLHHAEVLLRFVGRHSAGAASGSTLLGIITGYLPMVVLLVPLMLLLNKDQNAIHSHTLPAEEELRLRLKTDWLFSFAGALIGTGILCQMFSAMVLRYL